MRLRWAQYGRVLVWARFERVVGGIWWRRSRERSLFGEVGEMGEGDESWGDEEVGELEEIEV